MDVTQAVMARRSIRAFSEEPVPKEKLEEIMGAALRAPSWGNTQPWGFAIVGGAALDCIREECVEMTR
ncbi:MAG: nitroreductase family protein, partial [Thermodesulfobacteriota bacterium]